MREAYQRQPDSAAEADDWASCEEFQGVKQFEIWWAELPKPAARRPVGLLCRDDAYSCLNNLWPKSPPRLATFRLRFRWASRKDAEALRRQLRQPSHGAAPGAARENLEARCESHFGSQTCRRIRTGLGGIDRPRDLTPPLRQRFPQHLRALLGAEAAQPIAQLQPADGQDRHRQQRRVARTGRSDG